MWIKILDPTAVHDVGVNGDETPVSEDRLLAPDVVPIKTLYAELQFAFPDVDKVTAPTFVCVTFA
jgi:hypothetical protein